MRRSLVAVSLVAGLVVQCQDAVPGEQSKDAAAEKPSNIEDAAIDANDASIVDASDAETEKAPTFCDTVLPEPIFCDDFEQAPFKTYWDNINRTPDIGESGGGKLALDDLIFKSPPYSAEMYTPPSGDPNGASSAFLLRSVHQAPKDFMVRFDTRIDTEFLPDGGGKTIHIMSLHFVGLGFLILARTTSGTALSVSLDGGPPGPLVFLTPAFPVGQWKNIRVNIRNHPIDDSSPDGDVIVRIDTVDAAKVPLSAAFQSVEEIEVALGVLTAGVTGEFRMNVDNVLFYDRSDL